MCQQVGFELCACTESSHRHKKDEDDIPCVCCSPSDQFLFLTDRISDRLKHIHSIKVHFTHKFVRLERSKDAIQTTENCYEVVSLIVFTEQRSSSFHCFVITVNVVSSSKNLKCNYISHPNVCLHLNRQALPTYFISRACKDSHARCG